MVSHFVPFLVSLVTQTPCLIHWFAITVVKCSSTSVYHCDYSKTVILLILYNRTDSYLPVALHNNITAMRLSGAYLESVVSLGGPTFCYPQHTQRSIVLSSSTNTKPKPLPITLNVNVVYLFIITVCVCVCVCVGNMVLNEYIDVQDKKCTSMSQ